MFWGRRFTASQWGWLKRSLSWTWSTYAFWKCRSMRFRPWSCYMQFSTSARRSKYLLRRIFCFHFRSDLWISSWMKYSSELFCFWLYRIFWYKKICQEVADALFLQDLRAIKIQPVWVVFRFSCIWHPTKTHEGGCVVGGFQASPCSTNVTNA